MNKSIGFIVLVVVAAALIGCATAPKEPEPAPAPEPAPVQPAPEPPAQPKPEAPKPPPEAPKPTPVSAEDIATAQKAIANARAWGAELYAPDDYRQARTLFDQAMAARTSDPDKARQLLTQSAEKADAAYKTSTVKFSADMLARIQAADARLLSIQADKYMPAEYQAAGAGRGDVEAAFKAGDYPGGRTLGYGVLKKMSDLYTLLDGKRRMVNYDRWQAERAMAEGEKIEAGRYAPDQKTQVDQLYFQGLEGLKNWNLTSAGDSFRNAVKASDAMLAAARAGKAKRDAQIKKQADDTMLSVMKDIEKASALTVVTSDGTVVEPQAWSGEDELKQIENQTPSTNSQSMAIPRGRETLVMGDENQVTLLTQAKELWRLGVEQRNAGNSAKAIEYFREASRYIAAYQQQAVEATYDVRLIPTRPDCLWRIAEYKNVYNNPRMWVFIWRRNYNLITNPDLIYPKEKFVIPALPTTKEELNKQRAEASYLVGKEYEKVGNAAVGKEYIDAAFALWPQLKPGEIKTVVLPTAEELLAMSKPLYPAAPGDDGDYREAVKAFFIRMAGPFRDRNVDGLLAFFDGSVYLTDSNKEIGQADLRSDFSALFADSQGGAALLWSNIFNLNGIKTALAQGPSTPRPYTLDVDATENLSGKLSFWSDHQRYYIHRVGDSWRIYAIGNSAPPSGWTPKAAASTGPYAPAETPLPTSSEKDIEDSLTSWLTAWLNGDAAAGAGYMTQEVQFLRLNETLSGADLQTRLSSYFGTDGVKGTAVADLIDMTSASIEPSERFADKTTGPVYRLSVATKKDVSDSVPFWAAFQDYFFIQDQGAWKIMAIF